MPRRHGSLQFRPRKRAETTKVSFRSYPELKEGPKLGGFPGYKVGMLHLIAIEDRPGRPTTGTEIAVPSTVIETPPVNVVGIRAYKRELSGLKPIATGLIVEKDDPLSRLFPIGNGIKNFDKAMEAIEGRKEEVGSLRLILRTNPQMAGGLSKKVPELLEVPILGGSIESRIDYARNVIGNTIRVMDVFREGQLIDITGVTKGKGFQGAVKRFGIEMLPHKSGKGRKKPGSLGSRHPPYITWRVPRPGQLGYHKRTEYNKRIMKIVPAEYENGVPIKLVEDLNPPGGFINYGLVRSDCIIISGSVMGPPRRFIMMRHPIRPPSYELGKPKIVHISTIREVSS
ncbi:MAG: 50S ribosomal protein L3 [Candidatus Methanodesulfokora washburnensis]|jgi:large subunit ribosomal protein L3